MLDIVDYKTIILKITHPTIYSVGLCSIFKIKEIRQFIKQF